MGGKIILGMTGAGLIIGAGGFLTVGNNSSNNNQNMTNNEAAVSESWAGGEYDRVYKLKPEQSKLEWAARRIIGNAHRGEVALKEGRILEKDGEFKGGEFIIDMAKITETNNNEMLLNHIRSDDFFAVEKYPEAIIRIEEIKKTDGDKFLVKGELTVKDRTEAVEFEAAADSESGSELKVRAEFKIDRTRWGINFDSGTIFQRLGDKAIKDEIEFKLELVLEEEVK